MNFYRADLYDGDYAVLTDQIHGDGLFCVIVTQDGKRTCLGWTDDAGHAYEVAASRVADEEPIIYQHNGRDWIPAS